jgi:non-heme chloroperoxidase
MEPWRPKRLRPRCLCAVDRRVTLIIHGDDDQIVPIGASDRLSSKIVKDATLKVYPGAPPGLCSTLKDRVNDDLLAFFKA